MPRTLIDGPRNDVLDVVGAGRSFQARVEQLRVPLPVEVRDRLLAYAQRLEPVCEEGRALQQFLGPYCGMDPPRKAA